MAARFFAGRIRNFCGSSPGARKMALSRGMFVCKNQGPSQPYDFSHPLAVAAGDVLQIFIHGIGNVEVDHATWRTRRCCLIPQLLTSIGDRATVHIHLSNSANVVVTRYLALAESAQPSAAALISTLIKGPIGRQATLRIRMENCANVSLAHDQSRLEIAGGSLIDSLVDLPAGSPPLANVELDIVLRRCAQVSAGSTATASGSVHVHKGQLVNEISDCQAIVASRIQIHAQAVANVRVRDLRIEDGELFDEVLDATQIDNSTVRINLMAVGNAHAHSIVITDGELVDEVLDVQSIDASTVSLTLACVACAQGGYLSIACGELMDEVIDASETLSASDIGVSMYRVGCFTGVRATIRSGELVDEIVDATTLSGCDVTIRLHEIANVDCQRLSLHDAQLLDEVVDCATLGAGCAVSLHIHNSACVRAASLLMENSQLMDALIDAHAIAPGGVKLNVSSSFKECPDPPGAPVCAPFLPAGK